MGERTATAWNEFSGLNEAYLQDLYERYRTNPESVDADTRAFFKEKGAPPNGYATPAPAPTAARPRPASPLPPAFSAGPLPLSSPANPLLIAGAVSLANAIRAHGHRGANLDPLGTAPPGDSSLHPGAHGIREAHLAALPANIIGGPSSAKAANALEAIQRLRAIYMGPVGFEFEHVSNAAEREWLREAVECGRFCPPQDPIDELKLLDRLTEVGSFERFLHTTFRGQTRFSLEGLGMMIPMLDEIIGAAAEEGTRSVLLGMAHRGRLNVLAHTMGKSYEQIIAEFMGHYKRPNEASGGEEGWTGDVKYHLGARKAVHGGQEVEMQVVMVPNPSHLEWVDPVIVGMDRASDESRKQAGPARQDELSSMSILIHGDASFMGQGIVAETLNLSRLPGYRIGGSIHLITNNQIGFTTSPAKGRSTLYASDLAKGFEVPVIHVNADYPEACILAARLAHAYREEFRKDVLIDLVGYRRYGHNEGDEPTFTQPKLYEKIGEHDTVRVLWAKELEKRGLIKFEDAQKMRDAAIEQLQEIRTRLQGELTGSESSITTSGLDAGGPTGGLGHAGPALAIDTAVPFAELAKLNSEIYAIPESFHLHPKLERPFGKRRGMFIEGAETQVEWAHAEALAFASLISEGTPIRMTGQDVGRGTFSQRHAILYDNETGDPFIPLQAIPSAQASFEIWDSPLSEQAVLGFEYGYSIAAPEALVLWEAQYGDFVNTAQAVIDQFIASGATKWGLKSGMVMLLPHGYEGQGPEHSSARLERFLQVTAEDNLRIVNCTTAAQYFHLLRRQARLLPLDPRPLVVMSPKSLLRHPLAASPAEDFAQGRFHPVLHEAPPDGEVDEVRRLILCSGKVYYDLIAGGSIAGRPSSKEGVPPNPTVAAARVEELYPFPAEEVEKVIATYPKLEEIVWLQEEPRNMGAWNYTAPRLRDIIAGRLPLKYIGRTRRASPSEGSHEWHVREQARLVEVAMRYGASLVDESLNPEVEHP